MKKYHVFVFFVLLVFCLIFSSCDIFNSDSLYPYIDYDIDYMGFKPGLTSSSSSRTFYAGLDEVIQAYFANITPSSSNSFRFIDGVTYRVRIIQDPIGGTPNPVWDHYWEKFYTTYGYDCEVGSCYVFIYYEIPSRGAAGTVYYHFSVVSDTSNRNNIKVYPRTYIGTLNPR